MAQIDRVPGAGVVDVEALLIGQQPVVAGVVDTFERDRRPELVAFGRMVVDDVEDHLDPGVVELVHHLLEFVDERCAQIARIGGKKSDRIVPPIIPETLFQEVIVVNKRVDRQQLDRRDPKRSQIAGDMGVGEPREGASQLLRHLLMTHGEAPDVHLVDDRQFPRDGGTALASPSEGGVDHPAFRNKGGAVPLVEAEVLVGMVEGVGEQLRAPFEAANELLGVGIDQQLVRVEAVSGFGFVWSIGAVTIADARPCRGQVAVPNLVGVFRQLDALELGSAIAVEEADLDPCGVSGKYREVDAEPIPGRTKRERSPFAKACA